MKKITILLIALFIVSLNSFGQEIGLNLQSASSFGIRIKSGNDKTLIRFTVKSLSGTNSQKSSSESKNKTFGAGLNFGIEKRKYFSDNFYSYFGSDILTSYTKSSYGQKGEKGDLDWTIAPGIGIVLGLGFNINDYLIISAEAMPSIWYSYGETVQSGYPNYSYTTKGINYGLISPGASLSLCYRFRKKN